jgi:hypothetical protein
MNGFARVGARDMERRTPAARAPDFLGVGMKTFDEDQMLASPSRPRWRTPRLTVDSVASSTRNDNAPQVATDGSVGTYNNTIFHENS